MKLQGLPEGLDVKLYYERGTKSVERAPKMSRPAGTVEVECYTGLTVAVLWDGENRHVGFSRCAPGDQFNRKYGRLIAIRRALFAKSLVDNKRTVARKGYRKHYFTTSVSGFRADTLCQGINEELFVRLERQGANETVPNFT